jgi:hypothetical protein
MGSYWLSEYSTLVCRHPRASIGLEFEEYTWREGEFLYLQVCAVGTDVAFPLTAEISIDNRTGTWYIFFPAGVQDETLKEESQTLIAITISF